MAESLKRGQEYNPSLETSHAGSQPNKRMRTSGVTDGSDRNGISSPPSKSKSKAYHEDGNLVIVAGDVAFKVHRGLLTGRSNIFRDMFVVGSQLSCGETFDGCPVVRVSESEEYMAIFLKCLYGYMWPHPLHDEKPFRIALKCSHKYQVYTLRRQFLDKLSENYPTDLATFDEMNNVPQPLGLNKAFTRLLPVIFEVEALWLAPAGLYNLFLVEDKLEIDQLPGNILLKFYRVSALLSTEFPKFIQNAVVREYRYHACCNGKWSDMHSEIATDLLEPEIIACMSPLLLPLFLETLPITKKLCQRCFTELEESIKEYRNDMWSKLPKLFDIGESWEELLKLKESQDES
ncbi:hypothetical protein M422DRAFT_70824 [Sphaerobolus stellatus SS14]|uniref:BTB domain-containing protein n=1 Tax=Sphaerobolus stellatus (strain SS14) TaxID=990650 RepID=A0A0C9UR90_SPHS4|nr:hypothetical protein M422DRAFT_70824 [Sphaerobolus stellatus SS14]